jgi:hypothetical protein
VAKRAEVEINLRRSSIIGSPGQRHGRFVTLYFGFASALSDIGLPRGDIPLALFAFNVGVELGQLAFIATALIVVELVERLEFTASIQHRALRAVRARRAAAFWLFERLAGFLT